MPIAGHRLLLDLTETLATQLTTDQHAKALFPTASTNSLWHSLVFFPPQKKATLIYEHRSSRVTYILHSIDQGKTASVGVTFVKEELPIHFV